jgi:hypothetical protein
MSAPGDKRMFKRLRPLRPETRPIAEDANRIVAKSSDRVLGSLTINFQGIAFV